MKNQTIYLFLSLILSTVSFAEGTKQIMPNPAVDIRFQVFDNGDSTRDFMTYVAEQSDRLYIRIGNVSTERIHFGFQQNNGDVYYRLRDPLGNIVYGPYLVPASGDGYIGTHAEAAAGPAIIDAAGYTSIDYTPNIPGDYYLEFNPGDANNYIHGTSNVKRTFNFFDVTVVDMTDSTAIEGRIWTSKFDFNCMSATNPFETEMHILSTDSILTSLDFNGIQPWGFEILANRTGTDNTGNIETDRASKGGNVNYPEYKLFLQRPDANEFPASNSIPELGAPSELTGCAAESYNIAITSTHYGIAKIELDINNDGDVLDPIDRTWLSNLDAGVTNISWDGNDGLGNPVPDNTTFKVFIQYQGGLTHIPLFDCENHTGGYGVNLIEPGVGTPEMFWDDTDPAIANGSNLTTGCTGFCHTWSGENNSTINTWWITHYDQDTLTFTLYDDCIPVAVNDTALVPRDTQTTFFVLENDTEPDAENVTVTIISGPSNGTINLIQGDTAIAYTPNPGYVGEDTIYYRICDPVSPAPQLCDSAFVYIDVQCDDDAIPDELEGTGDSDGDGVDDVCDLDSDNDGIRDDIEGTGDTDGDGIPDNLDLDSDNDGVTDAIEANNGVAPSGYNASTGRITGSDADGDGLLDVVDNDDATAYTASSSSIQVDSDYDGDGQPNRVDGDDDNDGILTTIEVGVTDADGNGKVDGFSDSNNDGLNDATLSSPPTLTNTDGTGNANYLDTDADGDGITDNREGQSTAGFTALDAHVDTDGDGIDDDYDVDNGGIPITPYDHDGDGTPDYIDDDSDNDGITDIIEGNDAITGDGVADSSPAGSDTDNDGLDDNFDSSGSYGGYSNYGLQNHDADAEPDWRDNDDDNDGIATTYETGDVDGNSVPDYLEAAPCALRQSLNSGSSFAVNSSVNVTNPNNALGTADLSSATIQDVNGALIDLELDETLVTGSTINLDLQRINNGAKVDVYESTDAVSYVNAFNIATTASMATYNYTPLTTDANYIRVARNKKDNLLDAVYYNNQCVYDWDMDGIGDKTDIDDDNDGISDVAETTGDTDGDGIPNHKDLDSDNDGIPDAVEANSGTLPANMNQQGYYSTSFLLANDADNDGMVDAVEPGASPLLDPDSDSDGFNDRVDLDSDADGLTDAVEANAGSLPANMDNNGQYPVAYATANDTDGDGLINDLDPDNGGTMLTNPDSDSDSTKDYLDLDSDGDTISDNEEGFDPDVTPSGSDSDADGLDNAYDPDAGGTTANLPDTDGDGIPDYLDICLKTTQDGAWNDPNTWGGTGTPTSCSDCVEILNSVTLSGTSYASSVDIQSGGTLDLAGQELIVCGDFTVQPGGTLNTNSGKLTMKGGNDQQICGTMNVDNLEIDNPAIVKFCSGAEVTIIDELCLTQGTLNTTNANKFEMNSDASGTALVCGGSGTGDIVGDITLERYDGGCAGYLTVGFPVTTTYQSFSGLYYQGFPSSSYPSAWKNIIEYDETLPGTLDAGYVNPTDITDTKARGTGFLIYQWGTHFPKTISLTGPVDMTSPFNLPVTYTDDPAVDNLEDGWNLVANPYPGSIDWKSSGVTLTNCCDAVYAYNRCGEQYSSYVSGVSVNGGSQYIPPLGGFWIKAHDSGTPNVEITRDAIVDQDQNLYREEERMTLNIEVSSSGYSDELAISFGDTASAHSDGTWFGAIKLGSGNPNNPSFYSIQEYPWGNYDVSISFYPPDYLYDQTVQLMLKPGFTGNYEMLFKGIESFGNDICPLLEDKLTGNFYPITSSDTLYTFTAVQDTGYTDRFLVHFNKTIETSVNQVVCHGANDGKIVVQTDYPSLFNWYDKNGALIRYTTNYYNQDSIINLTPGVYSVEISDTSSLSCGAYESVSVVTDNNDEIIVSSTITDPSTCNSNDGSIFVQVSGGVGNYTYLWNSKEGINALDSLYGGAQLFAVTDSLGCSKENIFNVLQPASPSAFFDLFNDTIYLDTAGIASLQITNYSVKASSYNWDFGDSTFTNTSINSFLHLYNDTGTFNVSLEAIGNGCFSYYNLPIWVMDTITKNTVDTNTVGIISQIQPSLAVNVYPNPTKNKVVVQTNTTPINATLEIYNSIGKLLTTNTLNDRITELDLTKFGNGLYILKIHSKNETISKHVIVSP